jgi:hypothetical protein
LQGAAASAKSLRFPGQINIARRQLWPEIKDLSDA